MKKLFCVSAALFIAVISIMASPRIPGKSYGIKKKKEIRWEPSRAVESQFSRDFPDARFVTWAYGAFVEAGFLDNTVLRTAYYDMDNNLVGTTTDMDVTALPEKARERIEKMYPGYTIDKVVFFDDNEANETDMLLYNQSFEDKDNYFPLLTKDSKQIILKVSTEGEVSFFQELK